MDKGQRAAGWAGQSGQVMSGHGGHCAGYTMCELRYGITAQLFSVNGRRSVRWLRLVVNNGCLCLDDMKPALEGGATGLEMGESALALTLNIACSHGPIFELAHGQSHLPRCA